MRFLVITHVQHIRMDNQWFAYAPYVREMNIWFKHVNEVEVIAPIYQKEKSKIDINYVHDNLVLNEVPSIQFTSFKTALNSIFKIPIIISRIYAGCKRADHIHLRCPGNIGLIGALVQIVFPKKIKTAKYAGNWDPKSKQPKSYRFQKWILKNTLLSKNLNALVYGVWPDQSKNVRPFFTASFFKKQIHELVKKDFKSPFKMIFVGGLVTGKQPLFAIELVNGLKKQGIISTLDIYGDGILKNDISEYLEQSDLKKMVRIHGNVDQDSLIKAYKNGHFIVLPSKSEGWPKALAEGMFFGCIPIATNVSCINWMLDEGRRGILIPNNLDDAISEISEYLDNGNLEAMSLASQQWSHQYTMDRFELEISKLLQEK